MTFWSCVLEELEPLLPIQFFDISWEVPHALKFPGKLLRRSFKLPDTSELLNEERFAELFMAWNEEGLLIDVHVDQPLCGASYPDYKNGDAIELFIDTRDVESGVATRFCHHFLILPEAVEGILYPNDLKSREFDKKAPQIWSGEADTSIAKLKKFSDGGGSKFGGCPTMSKTDFLSHLGIFQELTLLRTEELRPLARQDQVTVTTHTRPGTYQVLIEIAKEALYGFDPSSFDRLGFTYRINRKGKRAQHFALSSQEYTLERQPDLWATLYLKK